MSQSDEEMEAVHNTELNQPPLELEIQSKHKIDPPPNGGLKAWVQVLGAFMLFFNSWYIE
jgi:hypothetical protein